eukprot:30885-Pelagococcus_subviridis.AAC.2
MPGGMRRSRVCASSEGPNETSVGEADSAAARGGDAPREVQRTAKCEVDDVRSLHLFLRACYFVHADASSLDSLRMVDALRRDAVPLQRLLFVHRHAALAFHRPEEQFERLCFIFIHALAVPEAVCEQVGGVSVPTPGRSFPQLERLRLVSQQVEVIVVRLRLVSQQAIEVIVVAASEVIHDVGISSRRRLTPPVGRLSPRVPLCYPLPTELAQRPRSARQRRVRLLRAPPHLAHRGEPDAVSRVVPEVREHDGRDVLGDVVESHGQVWACGSGGGARESEGRPRLFLGRVDSQKKLT